MPTEYTDIAIRARIDDYVKEMKKLPGVSEKEVKAATKAMEKAWKLPDIEKQAKAQFDSLKKTSTVALGGIVGDVEDVLGAFETLGPATLGMGAAFLAGGALVGGLAVQFADVMARADELAPKLEALAGREIISYESIESARVAEAQIANLSTVSEGFAGVLVDTYVPSVEASTSALVALGAGAVGAYSDFADLATSITGPVVSAMVDLNLAINPVAWGLQDLVDKGREANQVLEDQVAELDAWAAAKKRHDSADDKLLDATKKQNEEMERQAVADIALAQSELDKKLAKQAAAAERAADAVRKLHEEWAKDDAAAVESNIQDAGQAIMAYAKAGAAATQATADMWAELDELIDREDLATTGTEQINDALGNTAINWDAVADAAQGALDIGAEVLTSAQGLNDQLQRNHDDEIARLEGQLAKKREAFREALKNGDTKLAAEIRKGAKADKTAADLERAAAKRAYNVGKAMAITGIAINAASAAMAMLANPAIALIPPPGNVATAIGIAGGMAALQIAAVAAAPAPKAHIGRAPDEVDTRVLKREAILSPQGVHAAGGSQGVNALNRGQAPGGGAPVLYFSFDGRQPERLVTSAIRNGGSAQAEIRRATRESVGAGRYAR